MKVRSAYKDIIVIGTIAYDEILVFPGRFVDYLQKDKLHQINVSFVVDRLDRHLGGIALNIAYNIRLIDSQVPLYPVSAVGKDHRELDLFLKKNGIDKSFIVVDESVYSATGKAITDRADNQIWGYYYGPSRQSKEIDLTQIAARKSLVVLAATHQEAFLHFQKQAIEIGCDYMYDAGMTLTWISDDDLQDGVTHCRWLIGNDYEIATILARLHRMNRELTDEGIAIITTLGEKGVIYESRDENHDIPICKVERIVDPTGAGDAWRGGFIAGLVGGLKIRDCLIQANALASFAVEKMGTVNHTPAAVNIADRVKKIRSLL